MHSCAGMHSAYRALPARSRDFAHPWYAASTCRPRSWTRAIVSTLTPQRSAISGAGGGPLRSADIPSAPACTRKSCQTTAKASTWAQAGRAGPAVSPFRRRGEKKKEQRAACPTPVCRPLWRGRCPAGRVAALGTCVFEGCKPLSALPMHSSVHSSPSRFPHTTLDATNRFLFLQLEPYRPSKALHCAKEAAGGRQSRDLCIYHEGHVSRHEDYACPHAVFVFRGGASDSLCGRAWLAPASSTGARGSPAPLP